MNAKTPRKARKANGCIVWEGPSPWDGSPIAMIATGFRKSANRKTGNMVQTWILRTDMSPTDALKAERDDAICGACPHRGQDIDGRRVGRSCYVNVGQAPNSVYKAYKRGTYARLEDMSAFAGRAVRLGAYGDPAMVPYEVVAAVVANAKMWTGYTHQWKGTDARFSRFLMASCDSVDEHRVARAAGWRSFVVVARDTSYPAGTVECAAVRATNALQCDACGMCAGTRNGTVSGVSVAIRAHGTGAKYVQAA